MEEKKQFKWGVVAAACIAIFIIVLDSSAMNVAISAVVVDLNTDLSTIQALIAIYALTMASLMLAGSKLQDVLGRKKTFFVGLIIYACGTTTATLSVNVLMLLIGWSLLEGIGAALMSSRRPPWSVRRTRERPGDGIWHLGGHRRPRSCYRPPLWRGSHVLRHLAIDLCVRTARGSRRNPDGPYLRESTPSLGWRDIDLGGVVLSVTALFCLVFGILLLGSPQYWRLVPLFIILGSAFCRVPPWQRRRINHHAEPLFDISVLKNRLYLLGSATSAIQQVAFGGVLFILPVFLLQVTRVSAFTTGVALLPMSIAIFVLSVTGGRLTSIVSPKVVSLIGFLIAAAGAYLLRDVFSQSTQPVDIIPGTVIFGIGVGLLLSQLTNLTMSAARKDQEIDASGFLNTAKNLGYSVGTALIGAILLVGIFNGLVAGISTSTLVSNTTTQEQIQQNLYAYAQNMQTSAPPDIPQSLIPEAQRILDSTISSAMHLTFVSLTLILLLGFVITVFLPRSAK